MPEKSLMTRAESPAHAGSSSPPADGELTRAEGVLPAFKPALGPIENRLWARILLIAAIYVATALIARSVGVSAGFATSLWPPAGLAVVGLIVLGIRSSAGVWLGAFLSSFLFDPTTTGAFVAATWGAGATLQAVLGAWFAGRYLRSPFALASNRSVVRILFLAGPVACIASASFGVAALVGFERLAPENALSEWLAAWAGDTIGVLLFGPLGLLAVPGIRPEWASGRGGVRIAIILLVTAVLLGVGRFGVYRIEAEHKRAEILQRMDEVVEIGLLPLPGVVAMLEGVERFITASPILTSERFATY